MRLNKTTYASAEYKQRQCLCQGSWARTETVYSQFLPAAYIYAVPDPASFGSSVLSHNLPHHHTEKGGA